MESNGPSVAVQEWLREAHRRSEAARQAVSKALPRAVSSPRTEAAIPVVVDSDPIYLALKGVAPPFADSYRQVIEDIKDENRVSWAGTAHEVRQVLASLLHELAPDDEVTRQPWYKAEKDSRGPTQSQRAKYVLKSRQADSVVIDVANEISTIEDRVARLVRSIYSRGSDAAHRFKSRVEVERLLGYFQAIARDLLDI